MSPTPSELISKVQKTRRVSDWVKKNLLVLNLASFVCVIVLCGAYIVQVNHAVAKGYQMRDYETQISTLTLQNQKLEVDVRQAQSLDHVARAVKMMGMVRAEQPDYVKAGEPSYAMAE